MVIGCWSTRRPSAPAHDRWPRDRSGICVAGHAAAASYDLTWCVVRADALRSLLPRHIAAVRCWIMPSCANASGWLGAPSHQRLTINPNAAGSAASRGLPVKLPGPPIATGLRPRGALCPVRSSAEWAGISLNQNYKKHNTHQRWDSRLRDRLHKYKNTDKHPLA